MSSPSKGHARSQSQSCLECRRRKTRCDKQVPCGRCTTSGRVCSYEQLSSAKKGVYSKGYIQALEARLQDMESGAFKLAKPLEWRMVESSDRLIGAVPEPYQPDGTPQGVSGNGQPTKDPYYLGDGWAELSSFPHSNVGSSPSTYSFDHVSVLDHNTKENKPIPAVETTKFSYYPEDIWPGTNRYGEDYYAAMWQPYESPDEKQVSGVENPHPTSNNAPAPMTRVLAASNGLDVPLPRALIRMSPVSQQHQHVPLRHVFESTRTRIAPRQQRHSTQDELLQSKYPENRRNALDRAIRFRDERGPTETIPYDLVDDLLEQTDSGKYLCFCCPGKQKARTITPARDHVRKSLGNFPFQCSNPWCQHSSLRQADLNKHMKTCPYSFSPSLPPAPPPFSIAISRSPTHVSIPEEAIFAPSIPSWKGSFDGTTQPSLDPSQMNGTETCWPDSNIYGSPSVRTVPTTHDFSSHKAATSPAHISPSTDPPQVSRSPKVVAPRARTRMTPRNQHHQYLDSLLRAKCPKDLSHALDVAIRFRDEHPPSEPIPNDLLDELLEWTDGDKYYCFCCPRTRRARTITPARDHLRKSLGNFPYPCPNSWCRHSSLQQTELNQHMKTCINTAL